MPDDFSKVTVVKVTNPSDTLQEKEEQSKSHVDIFSIVQFPSLSIYHPQKTASSEGSNQNIETEKDENTDQADRLIKEYGFVVIEREDNQDEQNLNIPGYS